MKTLKRKAKIILYSLGIAASVGAFSASVIYKVTNKFKPSFYNYKAAISKNNEKELSKNFLYKQFNEINEFQTAMLNNHAALGIGTEFLATKLIRQGKLSKINYSKLLKMPELKEEDYEEAVRVILRDNVFLHLKSYDKYLQYDENGNEINAHLWEYFFPYIIQDMVITYNINKLNIDDKYRKVDQDGKLLNEIDFNKVLGFESSNTKFGIIDILKALKTVGYNKYMITDAFRDNMLYGSTYDVILGTDGIRTSENFTGEVTEETYTRLIDNFKSLIKDGTGYDFNDTKHITFKGEGLEIVNRLVDPNDPTNATIMYNGDAVDSYYSSDNSELTIDGQTIRFVRPSQNIFLVDGIMFSSTNAKENNDNFTDYISNNIFQNLSLNYQSFLEIKQNYSNYSFEEAKNLALIKSEEKLFKDFQFAKYSELFNYYRDENVSNQFANQLLDSINELHYSKYIKTNDLMENHYISVISEFIQPVIENLSNQKSNLNYTNLVNESTEMNELLVLAILKKFNEYLNFDLTKSFANQNKDFSLERLQHIATGYLSTVNLNEKEYNSEKYNSIVNYKMSHEYLNLDNFDFINYATAINSDMLFVYKNYFIDDDFNLDPIAQDIFWVDNGDKVQYQGLAPIEDYLNSKVVFEYYKQTKA